MSFPDYKKPLGNTNEVPRSECFKPDWESIKRERVLFTLNKFWDDSHSNLKNRQTFFPEEPKVGSTYTIKNIKNGIITMENYDSDSGSGLLD